jgi:hypothetical protein
MIQNHEAIITMVKTGVGVQAVADYFGIKRSQVEYAKKKNGLQGKYRKQREVRPFAPSQAELLEEYDYLGFETTERGTIICTIGDVSGDEQESIKAAVKSAFEKLLKEDR